jgi:hypothetical protein
VVEDPREAQRSRPGASLARGSLAMLYRRSSPTPPRLLLRIVATAGTGTLFAVAACSSSGAEGLGPGTPSDASDTSDIDGSFGCGNNPCGSSKLPDDASDTDASPDATMLACGGGVCGTVALPDAGDGGDAAASEPDAGIADGSRADAYADDATVDAAEDAGLCHPCGVVVHLDE